MSLPWETRKHLHHFLVPALQRIIYDYVDSNKWLYRCKHKHDYNSSYTNCLSSHKIAKVHMVGGWFGFINLPPFLQVSLHMPWKSVLRFIECHQLHVQQVKHTRGAGSVACETISPSSLREWPCAYKEACKRSWYMHLLTVAMFSWQLHRIS